MARNDDATSTPSCLAVSKSLLASPQSCRTHSNETYKGTWWYGRARYVSTEDGVQVHEQPEEEWIGVPFPPIVDEETWERARVLRRRRYTKAKRNTKVFYLLQHLLRCTECGLLMGRSANTKKTVKRNGKTYKYELDPPRRYYKCYGYQTLRLRCREKPMIRAERLEELVWNEVRRVLANPELIVAGLESLTESGDGGLDEERTRLERDLQRVQLEEDRAIRLYVTGKITEEQLDQQRRFITERLERLRAELDACRARESGEADQRLAMEQVLEWAKRAGDGLDGLSDGERREILNLLLDEGSIDGDNNVTLTLAIPTDDFVSIGPPVSRRRRRTAGASHRRSPLPQRARPDSASGVPSQLEPHARRGRRW